MSFSSKINKFVSETKQNIGAMQGQAEENAKKVLVEILGEEANKITFYSLDTDVGKFFDVQAPDDVIERLRAADLLRD